MAALFYYHFYIPKPETFVNLTMYNTSYSLQLYYILYITHYYYYYYIITLL